MDNEGMELSVVREQWIVEEILDENFLYRNIHFGRVNKTNPKAINPSAFDQDMPDVSCDWDRYSDVGQILQKISKEPKKGMNSPQTKNPNVYAVCRVQVSPVRQLIEVNEVVHDPKRDEEGEPDNRAHSLIMCNLEYDKRDEKNRVKARAQLAGIAEMIHFDYDNYTRWEKKEIK